MRKFFTLFGGLTFLLFSMSLSAKGFADENLHYVITYKWGLIHKDAGDATLSLRNNGKDYNIMLAARTKPWADRFYQVRDTLLGKIRMNDLRPLSYTKIAHEKGKYGKDVIKYSYSGSNVKGHCTRFRKNKEGNISESEKTLQATGPVYDMLSVFYYLRLINYDDLQNGKTVKATVFSGSKAETITIKSLGKETISLRDKTKREAYHIRFNFTTGGKKKSSEDIDSWISTDPMHIPLYLVGQLPVGQVRVYFTGN